MEVGESNFLFVACNTEFCENNLDFSVTQTSKGADCLIYDNFKFRRVRRADKTTSTWRCCQRQCAAQLTTDTSLSRILGRRGEHVHGALTDRAKEVVLVSAACKRAQMEALESKPGKILKSEFENRDHVLKSDMKRIARRMYRVKQKLLPTRPRQPGAGLGAAQQSGDELTATASPATTSKPCPSSRRMETACLRPQEPYGPCDGRGAGPGAAGAALAMKHATFPRSARTERDSPRKPPTQQPSCDCCPYGYHIDLDFVRFCERLAGAGAGSPTHAATKARRRERRRQRQSMDVLLGLAAPPEQPQVWVIEQTMPQMPPSPVSLPPHASILVRDALQRAVRDFEETLERSTPAPVPLSPAPAPPVPPRIPPRRYQIETTCSVSTSRTSSTSSPGPGHAPVSARSLEQALDAGLWAAAASAAPAPPALQNIRAQIARSLERMRELEEEVKMIPVLKVQLSVLQEEKRKMLLQIKQVTPIKQNGISHFDVLKIEEPVRSRVRPSSLDGLHANGPPGPPETTATSGPPGPKRRATRDIGVGCTVLTRDVGLMPPPPRLRTVAVGTEPGPQRAPSPRLSLSATWTEDIPRAAATTAARGVQTTSAASHTRGVQTDAEPLPPPAAETRDAGVQAQPMPVQRTHAGVLARAPTAEAAVSCAPKTRDAASSEHTVDDVLCAKCNVRKRTVGVDAAPWSGPEAEQAKRVCLSALGDAASAPEPTAPAAPAVPAKPRTRTVGCGTAGDRINPFSVHRAVNTDPPTVAAVINRGVNTDAVPAPVKPTTVSRGTTADVRTPSSSRATNTDARAATAARATNTEPRSATMARATNTEALARRDAGTTTTRKQLVDAGVTCSLADPNAAQRLPAADKSPSRAPFGEELARGAPTPSPPPTLSPLPQSRIPRPSSTTPTSPGPPPRRQFKRQDTYTKEPAPVVDITNKSPPPRRAHAETRQSPDGSPAKRQVATPLLQQGLPGRQQDGGAEDKDAERENSAPPAAASEEDDEEAADEEPHFKPIRNRMKSEPSKEMRAALKVLDDHLQLRQTPPSARAGSVPQELRNAFSIVQLEWFKVSSTKSADPLEVEDYLDYFEYKSTPLLEYVINMTDNSGNTAMHYAVSHGNFDVVSVLLDSKVCNVDVVNTAGYTSVMLVSLAQVRTETHRHVVRRLFHLADVNQRAKQHGQTALMLAVSHGRLDTVRLLLEAGADVNIQDEDGSTALMCAAEHGHLDILKVLLAQPDCDVTVVDHDGSTALSIAMEAGHRDIGVLLYAQEHFSRGSSPYNSLKGRRARSVTPTARPLSGHGLPAAPGAAPSTPPPVRRTATAPGNTAKSKPS